MCRLRHLVYGTIEDELVGLRGLCEAAEFTDKLDRRRADFLVRRRWFEVMQGFDVSAHIIYYSILGLTGGKYKICGP